MALASDSLHIPRHCLQRICIGIFTIHAHRDMDGSRDFAGLLDGRIKTEFTARIRYRMHISHTRACGTDCLEPGLLQQHRATRVPGVRHDKGIAAQMQLLELVRFIFHR